MYTQAPHWREVRWWSGSHGRYYKAEVRSLNEKHFWTNNLHIRRFPNTIVSLVMKTDIKYKIPEVISRICIAGVWSKVSAF